MAEEKQLTIGWRETICEELDYLRTVRRPEIAERIKEAIAFGDISENSEYDAAKNEQAELEYRIGELETILKNATIVENDKKKDTPV